MEGKLSQVDRANKDLEKSNRDLEKSIKDFEKANRDLEKSNKDLDKKVKSLTSTIQQLAPPPKPQTQSQLCGRDEVPEAITRELDTIAPVLAVNLRVKDRVHLASELCQGIADLYTPSDAVKEWFQSSLVLDVAMNLPYLSRPKTMLDAFTGEVGDKVKCTFEGMRWEGRELTLKQRQYLQGVYLVCIDKEEVYVNTRLIEEDLKMASSDLQTPSARKNSRKKSIDEEQMLDIAEMCFMRISDALIKAQITVKECFSKYAKPETLPESKAVLELIPPI